MEPLPEIILVVAFDDVVVRRPHLREVVYSLLELVFDEAGVNIDRTTIEDHGDRALILPPRDVPPFRVAGRVLNNLVGSLSRYNASHSVQEAIGLRVGLHLGDAGGPAIDFALRLFDAITLAPHGGALVVLASEDFYDQVIVNTPAAYPDEYDEIAMAVKSAESRVWLRLIDTRPETVGMMARNAPDLGYELAALREVRRIFSDYSLTRTQVDVLPVTIYVSDEAVHERVEAAVEELLDSANLEVIFRDDPVLGSWFRIMLARVRYAVRSPVAREIVMMAAHAAESRAVHAHDAEVTAKLMQNLGPLIAALQPTEHAVVRVGALLIVKRNGVVSVHQLTAAQQLTLDHTPHLAARPHQILELLEVAPDQD